MTHIKNMSNKERLDYVRKTMAEYWLDDSDKKVKDYEQLLAKFLQALADSGLVFRLITKGENEGEDHTADIPTLFIASILAKIEGKKLPLMIQIIRKEDAE